MDPDALEELERMASIASIKPLNTPPNADEIQRWITLFKYTPLEAVLMITKQRNDITRAAVTDEHWSLVREEMEKQGYSKEAYEHSLSLKDVLLSQSSTLVDEDGVKWTLYRLGGLLESEEKIRGIVRSEGEMGEPLRITLAKSVDGQSVRFCWVDEVGRERVENWIQMQSVFGLGGGHGR